MKEALNKKTEDNVTIVVVFFNWEYRPVESSNEQPADPSPSVEGGSDSGAGEAKTETDEATTQKDEATTTETQAPDATETKEADAQQ